MESSISCIVFIFTVLLTISICATEEKGCEFEVHKGTTNDALMNLMKPILYRRYKTQDEDQQYEYLIGVCINAADSSYGEGGAPTGTGVLQVNMKDKRTKIVGKYKDASIIRGHGWLILEYSSGDVYHSHCGNEPRRARIMMTCDRDIPVGDEVIVVVEEQNNRTKDCYYLFEMNTIAVCGSEPLITVGLSAGSVIVIVFVCVVVLYLVAGFAYNRFVTGAKGMEQLPNYSFWQDFGNLQADGCNFVCRSGGSVDKRTYKGVGDDQLQEEEDRDDSLLPM